MKPRPCLIVGADRIELRAVPADPAASNIRPYECLQQLAPALECVLADLERRRAPRVTVLLEPPLVQLRTLTDLPPAKLSELRKIIQQQPTRYFRRGAYPLVTDARCVLPLRPLRRNRGPLRAAAVEQAVLDAIAGAASAQGVRVESAAIAGEVCGLQFKLTQAGRAADRPSRREWRRLAFACAVLLGLPPAVLLTRLRELDHHLDQDLARLAAPARAVARAHARMDELHRAIDAVSAGRRDRAAALSRMVAALGSLPDSAYVVHYVWDSHQGMRLSGYAPAPERVATRLTEAALGRVTATDGEAALDPPSGDARLPFSLRVDVVRPR